MASKIKWTAIEHSLSKQKGKHVMMVAYEPKGAGMNSVRAVVPLYDIRDTNLDGSVSVGESAWAALTSCWDPYYVFSLLKSADEASFMIDAAIQMRDWELRNQATADFLRASFKVSSQALTTILVEKGLSPGIELNLANTGLANLGAISEFAQFVVLSAMENVIIGSICSTHN